MTDGVKDVFVSRPTWVPPDFREGLDGFLSYLESHDLRPRTLGVTDYPSACPLDEVIALLDRCDGAIILGYPQVEIDSGKLRGELIRDLILPTEWNHIEAGLAYATGLPLLLLHHPGIRRGIFDHGTVDRFVYEVDLSNPAWSLAKPVVGAVRSWKAEIAELDSRETEAVQSGSSGGGREDREQSGTRRRLEIPRDLASAVRLLEKDFRVPTEADLTGNWWRHASAESGFPVWCEGEFTGRTSGEIAAILLAAHGPGYKIVVFTEDRHGNPDLVTLASGDTPPQSMFLAKLERGSHPVSRSVWKRGGPRTLHLKRDGVEVGVFESASAAFYWDNEAERFVRQWMSD